MCFTDILKVEKECETRLLSAKFHMFHKGEVEQEYTGLLIKTSACWRPLSHLDLNLLVGYEWKRLFVLEETGRARLEARGGKKKHNKNKQLRQFGLS